MDPELFRHWGLKAQSVKSQGKRALGIRYVKSRKNLQLLASD